jgi:sugar-specific transcriptional regulator TrmB
MNTKLIQIIENLGLEAKEARVYLAALELGGASVLEISKKANVERVNTYYVLGRLAQRGIIYESTKGRSKAFFAIDPKKLESMVQTRLEDYRNVLPELITIENANDTKPKIRFYEGKEGIKQVFDETLRLKPDTEILAIATASGIYASMESWTDWYLKTRVKKGIRVRAIVEASAEGIEHQKIDERELRTTRLVPQEKFPFRSEINIFGDKVMIASFRDQMGVIIESRDLAVTQRAFFELAWEGAGNYS